MQKTRKICCRITPRRVMGAILIAASVVNLLIVGAAYKVSVPDATPTSLSSPTSFVVPPLSPSATIEIPTQVTLTPTTLPTQTFTATFTPTDTPTATFTDTPSPSPRLCMPQYSWPVYVVQQGDSLSAIASITASSVPELMLANCLPDTRIYTRQQLYVPRLPTPIPTDTPTDTPIIPTNGPTVFQNPSVCYDTTIGTQKLSYSIFITVTPYDLEGISSLLVSYRINGGGWSQLPMTSFGNYYAASAWLTSAPTRADLVYYIFQATDNAGNVQKSSEQSSALVSCTVIN